MDYQIALNPELDLTPADFVQAWNTTQEARAVAEAHLAPSSQAFDPFLVGAIAVISSIVTSVTADLLSDLIKKVVAKKKGPKPIRVIQINQPDGKYIFVIDQEDE
jgi:hypothetical protein